MINARGIVIGAYEGYRQRHFGFFLTGLLAFLIPVPLYLLMLSTVQAVSPDSHLYNPEYSPVRDPVYYFFTVYLVYWWCSECLVVFHEQYGDIKRAKVLQDRSYIVLAAGVTALIHSLS